MHTSPRRVCQSYGETRNATGSGKELPFGIDPTMHRSTYTKRKEEKNEEYSKLDPWHLTASSDNLLFLPPSSAVMARPLSNRRLSAVVRSSTLGDDKMQFSPALLLAAGACQDAASLCNDSATGCVE